VSEWRISRPNQLWDGTWVAFAIAGTREDWPAKIQMGTGQTQAQAEAHALKLAAEEDQRAETRKCAAQ
jgi:hypothetical protein